MLIQQAEKEAATITEQLHGTESEVKALRSMTQRMVLTQHEMVGGHCCVKNTNVTCSFFSEKLTFTGRSCS